MTRLSDFPEKQDIFQILPNILSISLIISLKSTDQEDWSNLTAIFQNALSGRHFPKILPETFAEFFC